MQRISFDDETRYKPRRRMPFWLKAFAALTVAGVVVAVGGVVAAAVQVQVWMEEENFEELWSEETIRDYRPPVLSRFFAADGQMIDEFASEDRVLVPIESIPMVIQNAFISAEDKNFRTHSGVDFIAVGKAQVRNAQNCLSGGCTRQGGSSITQQVAKNFFLTREQTIKRKALEMILARRIERILSKQDILELYLNEIPLGRRYFGVAAAALGYFGKPLDELTLSEAAYLAALPKAPSTLDITKPDNRPRAEGRRNYVVDRMLANGYVTAEEAEAAKQESLVPIERFTDARFRTAGYFSEQIRREVIDDMYGGREEEFLASGLAVRSTLDTDLQRQARDALRRGLEEYDRRHGYRGPLDTLDLTEDWRAAFAERELPSAVDGWRMGVVLEIDEASALVEFQDGGRGRIPYWNLEDDNNGDEQPDTELPIEETPLNWARAFVEPNKGRDGPYAPSTVGPAVSAASDVLAVGDVILAEALEEAGDMFALRQVPDINGAILAMDPHTGRVVAMVGGYYFNYGTSELNRTRQAQRQPGSSFKPFIYAAAYESGWTPADRENAGPYFEVVDPNDPESDTWEPSEYIAGLGSFRGEMTLRRGLELSKNTLAIRVARDLGYDHVADFAERFGVYGNLNPYGANMLGAQETTVWRMVRAYAMFVNGGKFIEPTILDRVQDRDGHTTFPQRSELCGVRCQVSDWSTAQPPVLEDTRPQIISEDSAFQIVYTMLGVVENGTARSLQAIGKTVAGKTGTTNDFRDAWFVGFSPDLVVGVYVGFDQPRSLGRSESGGAVAAPIFKHFMTDALADQPDRPFRQPPSITLMPIDSDTGLQHPKFFDLTPYYGSDGCRVERPILEAFKIGTGPTVTACEAAGSFVEPVASEPVCAPGDLQCRLAQLQSNTATAGGDDDDEDVGGIY